MPATILPDLRKRTDKRPPFVCLTAYDASFARVISEQGIEVILVGDSLGMTIQGHDSTLPVTVAQMAYHTTCVRRGNRGGSLIIADLPFAACGNLPTAVRNAARLMRAGATAVKIEGGAWLADIVRRLCDCGIPVCGHLGLQPQSVHRIGGYRKQGGDAESAAQLQDNARALEEAGISLLVLECIPAELAAQLTLSLRIPTIGIGCGSAVDAQVMVLQDILGISAAPPSFAKNFLEESRDIATSIRSYADAVRNGTFPSN